MTIGDEMFAAQVLQKVEVPKLCGRIPYAQTAEYLNQEGRDHRRRDRPPNARYLRLTPIHPA